MAKTYLSEEGTQELINKVKTELDKINREISFYSLHALTEDSEQLMILDTFCASDSEELVTLLTDIENNAAVIQITNINGGTWNSSYGYPGTDAQNVSSAVFLDGISKKGAQFENIPKIVYFITSDYEDTPNFYKIGIEIITNDSEAEEPYTFAVTNVKLGSGGELNDYVTKTEFNTALEAKQDKLNCYSEDGSGKDDYAKIDARDEIDMSTGGEFFVSANAIILESGLDATWNGDVIATLTDVNKKQDNLTVGTGIEINSNVISTTPIFYIENLSDGCTVNVIDRIRIVSNNFINRPSESELRRNRRLQICDAEGNVVSYGYSRLSIVNDYNGDVQIDEIVLNNAVTEPGTYTLDLLSGLYEYGLEGNYNDEIKFTITVEAAIEDSNLVMLEFLRQKYSNDDLRAIAELWFENTTPTFISIVDVTPTDIYISTATTKLYYVTLRCVWTNSLANQFGLINRNHVEYINADIYVDSSNTDMCFHYDLTVPYSYNPNSDSEQFIELLYKWTYSY